VGEAEGSELGAGVEGVPLGARDGKVLGIELGEALGEELGLSLGLMVGLADGLSLGLALGLVDGIELRLGSSVPTMGAFVGEAEGSALGAGVVGVLLGMAEGTNDG